ncbi:MAG: hypothetical protein LQ337_008999, partial [Flavoplaca oasis]
KVIRGPPQLDLPEVPPGTGLRLPSKDLAILPFPATPTIHTLPRCTPPTTSAHKQKLGELDQPALTIRQKKAALKALKDQQTQELQDSKLICENASRKLDDISNRSLKFCDVPAIASAEEA